MSGPDIPKLFDFEQDWQSPYETTWSYRTEIIRSYGETEQRVMKRLIPRRTDQITTGIASVVDGARLQALISRSDQDAPWIVPFWPGSCEISNTAGPGALTLTVADTANRGFTVGGLVVLANPGTTQTMVTATLVSTSATSLVVDALADTWLPGIVVCPANRGHLERDAVQRRVSPRYRDRVVLRFTMDSVADPGVSVPTGVPTFSALDPHRIELQDTMVRKVDRFDSPTYTFRDTDRGTAPAQEFELQFYTFNHAEVNGLLNFFHQQRGAYQVFYCPTYQVDLDQVGTIGAADVAITVSACGYTTYMFPLGSRQHLALMFTNQVIYRDVVGAVSAGATEVLTLSAPFGRSAIPDEAVLSYALYGRWAHDDMTIQYLSPDGLADIRLGFSELPNEAPGVGLGLTGSDSTDTGVQAIVVTSTGISTATITVTGSNTASGTVTFTGSGTQTATFTFTATNTGTGTATVSSTGGGPTATTPVSTGLYPAKPSSLTSVIELAFSGIPTPNGTIHTSTGLSDSFGVLQGKFVKWFGTGAIVSDTADPVSPSSAYDSNWYNGLQIGNGPDYWEGLPAVNTVGWLEWYEALWFQMVGDGAGTFEMPDTTPWKPFGYFGVGSKNGGAQANAIILGSFAHTGGTTNSNSGHFATAFSLTVATQINGTADKDYGGGTGVGQTVVIGHVCRVETYMKLSPTPGAASSTLIVILTDYTAATRATAISLTTAVLNSSTQNGGIYARAMATVWGGNATVKFAKTRDDHQRFYHYRAFSFGSP